MNLIIVESPTKARTLSKFLGNGFSVEATMGHIKDLPKSKLSVDIEHDFEPDYVVVPKKKDVISKLKKLYVEADSIYIATDPDREGEAIAAHVVSVLRDKKEAKKDENISRISFHEITKSAVEAAMQIPGKVNEDLVNAQVARRVLDRLVGYKLSPLLWKKVRRGLSAGRVQSVAVRLIVEREREIEAFKAEEYWEIYSDVKSKNAEEAKNSFLIKLVKIGEKKADVKEGETARKIVTDLEKSDYKVKDVRRKQVSKSPYPPFTTSTMTQAAARIFGWSAKKTMSLAQKLYEEGYITYHRTDSVNLAMSAVTEAREFISKTYGSNYIPDKPRFFKKTSKLAQEAHEAIRPTRVEVASERLEIASSKFADGIDKLYQLIWKRFVACQMSNSLMDETAIDVEANTKDGSNVELSKNYLLRTSGQVMKFDGWRKVMPLSKDEGVIVPVVSKDEVLDLIKVLSEQKFTQPPPRYNEASLIKALEKLGIGRPSTYAPIITTIQVRSYVEKSEGKFQPTPVGMAVTDFLTKNFSEVVDYQFTAEMESKLDNIAKGEIEWRTMMANFYKPFESKLGEVEKTSERVKIETEKLGRKCPTCETEGRTGDNQGELVVRIGRFGKFISCSLFPECKHTERFVEKVDMPCPKCKKGEVIIKYTKSKRKFFGCSRYPKCKWASWKKPGDNKAKGESVTKET